MKSIDVTLNAPILHKNAKRNFVRHPAKLSNILNRSLIKLLFEMLFELELEFGIFTLL